MRKVKHVVLPIEGNYGKYVVVSLKDETLVFIAQSMKIFGTHTDILSAFEKSQRQSPDAVLEEYSKYEKMGVVNFGGIRNRERLVEALCQFSRMSPMPKKNSLLGGARYHLVGGVLTLATPSETFWPVDGETLNQFRIPLKEYYAQNKIPLKKIVIR